MGDMERQRAARDIWISRGHLRAYAIGTVFLGALCFGLGVQVGQRGGHVNTNVVPLLQGSGVEGDLVELVSRVEANALPGGGLAELSFPDALENTQVESAVPRTLSEDRSKVFVGLAPTVELPGPKNGIPAGNYTLLLGSYGSLEAAEARREEVGRKKVDARVSAMHIDGQATFWVCAGAFSNEGAAKYAKRHLAIDRSGVKVQRILRPVH